MAIPNHSIEFNMTGKHTIPVSKIRIVFLAILAIALVIRLLFFIGFQMGDATYYSEAAYKIANGTYELTPSAYGLRFGFIVPIAVFLKLFGVNDFALVGYPLLCSIVCLILCYRIGSLLSNHTVGLLAALLLAFLPLNIYQSSDLHTDLPMSMWLALVLFMFLLGQQSSTVKNRQIVFLLAGIFMGFAYLTKLTALAFLPALLGLLFHYRKMKESKLALMGFFLIIVGELLVYLIATGNPFYRIAGETAQGNHLQQVKMLYPDARSNLLSAFLEVPGLLIRPYPFVYHPYFGYHFLIFFIGLFWILRHKMNKLFPLLLWMLLIYLPLSFAIVDFKNFTPAQIRYARTLEPLCLPAMIITAQFLYSIRRLWLVIILVILIPVSLLCIHSLRFDAKQEIEPVRQTYEAFVRYNQNQNPLYSDKFTVMALRYFDKYQNPELFQEFPPVAKEGFVLFNPISQDASKRWAGQNVPSWVLSLTQQEPLFMAYPKKRMVGGYRKRLMERGLLSALFDSYPDESQSITLYKVPAQNSQKQ